MIQHVHGIEREWLMKTYQDNKHKDTTHHSTPRSHRVDPPNEKALYD